MAKRLVDAVKIKEEFEEKKSEAKNKTESKNPVEKIISKTSEKVS